jgi:uncharacterized membrane protein
LILVVLAIASLVGGIISLVKYAKTKNKLMLILGIVFTFIIPGILLYFAFRIWVMDTMIVYGPAPMMVYGPMPPAK